MEHPKRLLIALTAAGGLVSAVLIYQYYREQLAWVREEQGRALRTIAEVKSESIASWRRERIADAEVVSANPVFATSVRDLFHHPRNASATRRLRTWLEQLKAHNDYRAVLLFDASGRPRLSSDPLAPVLAEEASSLATKAIQQRKVLFEDLHSDNGGAIHLAVLAPLYDEQGNVTAAIELRIDPARFLYPHIRTWPMSSDSGEALLVRREGEHLVCLNELRHRKDTALKLRLPVNSSELAAAQMVSGREGAIEGKDYRGVPVLAAGQRVPDSPWFLVAKIDQSEAYHGVRTRTRYFAAVLLLIVILSGCAVLLIWSRSESQHYRQLYSAEAQRRALAGHYEYLHRYANDIILLLDEHGRIVEANERAVEAYGYSREKLLTLSVRDLRDASELSKFEEQWQAAGSREGAVYETLHRRADGSVFPAEVSTRLMTVDGRAFRQSIIRDISERKRSEEALRQSEARLSRAQAIARLGSWEVDAPGLGDDVAGELYLWSDEVYRIFGVDRQTFRPSRANFLAAVHAEDQEKVAAAMVRVRSTGQPYEVEHRIVRPDGDTRYVREHADCILDAAGRVIRLIGTVQDITDYKQLEEQFLQAQKLESLGMLAGGVAHDFNNLLTIVNGYSDLLLQAMTEGDPLRDSAVEIRKAGERASGLTKQLLVFSRKQAMQARRIDLSSVVADAERMLKRLVGEDVQLQIRGGPALWTILADPGQMYQVIMNLVVNSRDAMPRGGSILIETSNVDLDERYGERHPEIKPGAYVMLAVSDTGVGMDDATKRRVFEPFFTTKPRGMGTGLGLATVYGIVKQSGGWIWLYSEVGKGTTFKIYLPRLESAETEEEKRVVPPADGSETILVVEDQAEVRKLAATVLRNHRYTVLEAGSAEEALAICRQASERIDLVVTDVVMPGLSGPELAEQMKELRPEAKVLFMSGYTDHANLHLGVLAGDANYIAKPFTWDMLLTRVREVVGGVESTESGCGSA